MKKLNSGFRLLDKNLGGFCAGELIVIGSRPYMKKGLFMERLANKIASEECLVLYVFNQFNPAQLICNQYISMFPSSLEIDELCNRIKEEIFSYKVNLVCIDNLEMISYASGCIDGNIRKEVATRLKKLATEIKIPIVILSELSEKVETRGRNKIKPKLIDLNGVQDIADKIILINRQEYYGFFEDEEGESTEGIYYLDVFNNTSKARIKFALNENINEFIELKTTKIY